MAPIKFLAVVILSVLFAGGISSQSIYSFRVNTIDGQQTTLAQ